MTTAGARYFVSADGKKLGPFTGQQIRTKLFRKTITEDDYVWRDGLGDSWVKIGTILDELPSDAVPPPAPEVSELSVNINHRDGSPPTVVAVPEKGVYEPPATLKQKNLLMKLGYENPETLRHIGRDQASYIIDRIQESNCAEMFARHTAEEQRATNKALAIAAIILLGIGLAVAAFYWLQSAHNQIQTTRKIDDTPVKMLSNEEIGHRKRNDMSPSVASPATIFTLMKAVSIQTPYGSVTLQGGTKLAFTSREGDNVRFRYLDADYEIPVSATDLK